jgi:hypothetical protein
MSYATKDKSIEDGEPYYLYEFNVPWATFTYKSFIDHTDTNPNLIKSPCTHTEPKQSNELSKNSIDITVPLEGDFAALFMSWPPDYVITVTLKRGQFGEDDLLVYWKGRITSHSLNKHTLKLSCESIFTSMRMPGLRAKYQKNCRHSLYSRGCWLDKNDFKTQCERKSFAGETINLPEASAFPDDYFTGGILEVPPHSYRSISDHGGANISIIRQVEIPLVTDYGYGYNYGAYYGGFYIFIYPGCDKTLQTCHDKFNNTHNQGGFKFIPSGNNPFGGSSIA